MEQIIADGKIAIVQSLEGAHHLNGKLENLDDFFHRGVAHMILPHFYTNEACGSVDPIPTDLILRKIGCFTYKRDLFSGLSPWGCQLVDRMWDLGMITDMTHATPRCRADILDRAHAHPKKRPVIMSHVGLHHFMPHPMNPTDDEIRRIADTGGVIGLIFMRFWLSHPEQPEAADILLKSVQHLINTGGEDCVAFGSDYDGFTPVPRDFKSPRDYNRLRSLLLRKFTETQVQKFLKNNALRVLKTGWGGQQKS
jgi:membrane dipeptidase